MHFRSYNYIKKKKKQRIIANVLTFNNKSSKINVVKGDKNEK